MTARELLRSCADSLENFQVVAGKADPRVQMLRALADRIDAEECKWLTQPYMGDSRSTVILHLIERLDAPLDPSPAPLHPGKRP